MPTRHTRSPCCAPAAGARAMISRRLNCWSRIRLRNSDTARCDMLVEALCTGCAWLVDRAAAFSPILEGAEIVDAVVAHVFEHLAGQRRAPARGAIQND